MTDEQVKQNADNYTESLMCENLHRTMYSSIDFIAGAHSRDEEIEESQNELESLRKGFYERGDKLKELMLANNKLRNPWISVKERLPEIDQTQHTKKKNLSIAVLAHDIDILHDALGQAYSPSVVRYDYERKDWLYVELGCYANEVVIGAEITHWMPIPQIKKGE